MALTFHLALGPAKDRPELDYWTGGLRSSQDIEEALTLHGDAVWRACVMRCPRQEDAQDVLQETFLKYAQHEAPFNDDEHVKAWLLRVAINGCIDRERRASTHESSLDAQREAGFDVAVEDESGVVREVLGAMHDLGDPPRTAVYLALYEGYTAPEIARMLDVPVNTVYSWISRGRKILQEVLSA